LVGDLINIVAFIRGFSRAETPAVMKIGCRAGMHRSTVEWRGPFGLAG
jgi:hypothetical protein